MHDLIDKTVENRFFFSLGGEKSSKWALIMNEEASAAYHSTQQQSQMLSLTFCLYVLTPT